MFYNTLQNVTFLRLLGKLKWCWLKGFVYSCCDVHRINACENIFAR